VKRVDASRPGLLFDERDAFGCFEGPARLVEHASRTVLQLLNCGELSRVMDEVVDRRAFDTWQMAIAEATRSKTLAAATARWRRLMLEADDSASGLVARELLVAFRRRSRRQDA
jgi:hypothetical protein